MFLKARQEIGYLIFSLKWIINHYNFSYGKSRILCFHRCYVFGVYGKYPKSKLQYLFIHSAQTNEGGMIERKTEKEINNEENCI